MIVPALTSWPPPALTPRRWPTLSRPFFELDPAFLWAIAYASSFLEARGRLGVSGLAASAAAGALARPRFGASVGLASAFVAVAFAGASLAALGLAAVVLAGVALALASALAAPAVSL